MNKDNLVFKMLRRGGYLDKISNKKISNYYQSNFEDSNYKGMIFLVIVTSILTIVFVVYLLRHSHL